MIYSTQAPANKTRPKKRPQFRPVNHARPAETRNVAVVVPVYADLELVRICLESLFSAVAATDPITASFWSTTRRRTHVSPNTSMQFRASPIGVVADQYPKPRICRFGQSRARTASRNEDVVLLNSDTVVPKVSLRGWPRPRHRTPILVRSRHCRTMARKPAFRSPMRQIRSAGHR